MNPRYVVAAILIFVGSWLTFHYLPDQPLSGKASVSTAIIDDDRSTISTGRTLYDQNCASCHGSNLEGEPNWRERKENGQFPAPPHDATGHTWHHSDEVLFNITKYGTGATIGDPNYQSDMPAYHDILSDREIRATLAYIKSRWPENIKKRHDLISNPQQETNPSRRR